MARSLWIFFALALGLVTWILWPEGPDSPQARAEVERRFGHNAHRVFDAYYHVPWNFVGHAPSFFRCRYDDESLVLNPANKKNLLVAESLRFAIPAADHPSWWRSEGKVSCLDRTICFDLERKLLFSYSPGQ